jgi:hypothetical protein
MLVFRKPVDESALEGIKEGLKAVETVVREGCGGVCWDGVCLAVGTKQSAKPGLALGEEEWEEMCRGFGFEFVDAEGKGRNEFGGTFTPCIIIPDAFATPHTAAYIYTHIMTY